VPKPAAIDFAPARHDNLRFTDWFFLMKSSEQPFLQKDGGAGEAG
jgi:hypothetical protein